MVDRSRLLLTRRQLLKAGGLTAIACRGRVPSGRAWCGTLVQPGRPSPRTSPRTSSSSAPTAGSPCRPSPSDLLHVARRDASIRTRTRPTASRPTSSASPTRAGLPTTSSSTSRTRPSTAPRCSGPGEGEDFRVQLTNVGLAQRPDLFDEHTVHWHGFKNVIPFFDGEPTGSVSVPQGQTFTYVYISHDPGTYMFHCHVEDTEHVHMGMTGLVFVRPAQDGNTALYPSGKYAYNDGDGSTGLRPRVRAVPERGLGRLPLGGRPHPAARMERLPGGLRLLNGRVYPDTLLPNGSIAHATSHVRRATRRATPNCDLVAPAGRPDLANQPLSSLITCNAGERVLLRFANLGFMEAAMTLAGIKCGSSAATPRSCAGRTGFDTATTPTRCPSGPARASTRSSRPRPTPAAPARAATATTPTSSTTGPTPGSTTSVGDGGGQRTEVRVYPAGTLPPQAYPNQHPDDAA